MTDTEILDILADDNNWVDSHGSYPCSFCIGGQEVFNNDRLLAIDRIPKWIKDKRAEKYVQALGMTCQDCGKEKKDVQARWCPFASEIHNEDVRIVVCDDCDHEREWDT